MPETAVLPADAASAGASASQADTSVGAGASQSDESILGITEDTTSTQTAESTAETTTETQQTTETQTQEQEPAWSKEAQEEGLFLTQPPPELKALFADPKIGKLVQSSWDSRQVAQAYREFIPTLKEARTIRETFPGGMDEMQRTVTEARESQMTDMAVQSGDPAVQRGLAERLHTDFGDSFVSQVKETLGYFAENSPETYLAIAAQVAPKFLEQERFPEFLDAADHVIQSKNGEQALRLLAELNGWSAQKGLRGEVRQRLAPEQARFNKERETFNKERQQAREGTWDQIRVSANSSIETQVQQHIAQKIDTVLPQHLKSNAAVKKSLGDKVFAELDSRLKQDVSLVGPYKAIKDRVLKSGRASEADQREISALIVNRATQLFPLVARAVIGQWTRDTIAASQTTTQRRESAATRRDISTGGAPSHRPTKFTEKDIKSGGRLSKMTDDEILGLPG